MHELIIMAVLALNNAVVAPGLPAKPIVAPVPIVQVQKWDLPACKPVEIEFINDTDRSA